MRPVINMLKRLRNKKTAKKVWIILAILILPPFILWGSGSLIRSKEEKETGFLGTVFGKKISFLEYRDAISAVRNQAIMQFGDSFEQIERYLNLDNQAWERIIVLSEAQRRKIKAIDREVIDLIRNYPFFRMKGQFNQKAYTDMLKYFFHIQPRQFEEQTRQNIMISKLFEAVTREIKINEEEIRKEYQKDNEQLSLYYIAAITSEFKKDIIVKEEEIREYFTVHNLEFKQPLSFNLEYLTTDSQDKIESLLPHINKKEYFNKLLKDWGYTLKQTGFFTETSAIPEIGWSPQVLNFVSKAKVGDYLGPVQIDKAYYLFILNQRREPFIPEFENIKDKVKDALSNEKAEEIAKTKIENCLACLKETYQKNPKTADFNKTAKSFGLKSSSTELFKYSGYIEGIGASDEFWKEAKRLKEDEISSIIKLPNGFYIIRLKSFIGIDEDKFKQEKDKLSQTLLLQKKQKHFTTFLEGLRKNSQRFQ